MKKILLLTILFILMLFCLTACQEQQDPPAADGVVTGLDSQTVIYDLAEDYQVNGTVKCGYASLAYHGVNEAAAKIDQALQTMMDDYYVEIAGYDQMLAAENANLVFTHERIYSLAYLGEQYISIVADGYDMTEGAAHPNAYLLAYVYDLQSGEQVQLADLLPEGYQTALKNNVLNQINAGTDKDSYYPNLEEAVEIALLSENWYIDDDCIWLIFNPGQISAHALGVIKFAYYYKG